jgi:hypothetical protein
VLLSDGDSVPTEEVGNYLTEDFELLFSTAAGVHYKNELARKLDGVRGTHPYCAVL